MLSYPSPWTKGSLAWSVPCLLLGWRVLSLSLKPGYKPPLGLNFSSRTFLLIVSGSFWFPSRSKSVESFKLLAPRSCHSGPGKDGSWHKLYLQMRQLPSASTLLAGVTWEWPSLFLRLLGPGSSQFVFTTYLHTEKATLAGQATKIWSKLVLHKTDSLVAVVQLLSCIQLFATPWTAAHQFSVSFSISPSLLKLTSIELVMPSNHPILCHPLLLLPSIFPRIRVFPSQDSLESCSTFSLEYLETQHSMAFFSSNSVGKDGLFCLQELGFQVVKIPCKQNVVLEFCSFST